MKTIHHGKLFLCFILVACVLATPTAYATGGGSFDVPQIHEDFNQGKPAPAPKPTEELNVAPSKQEKGFFSQVGDFVSGSWNKLKNGVSNTWNNLKNGAKKAWNTAATATKNAAQKAWDWMTSTAGKITGGIVLGIAALTGLFSKFGHQIKNGVQRAYSSVRQSIENWLYPNGTLKDREVTDRQLAFASDMTYKDVISEKNIETYLGEDWSEDKSLSLDLSNGLQAHVFVNSTTKEMIIAFRGTEPDQWQDIVIGDGPIALGNDSSLVNSQVNKARIFVKEQILSNEKYKHYKKTITGHSLGGYLAADCAARYKIPAVTFNAPGNNLFPNVNGSTLLGSLGGPKGAAVLTAGSYVINLTDPHVQVDIIKESTGAYDKLIRNYRFNDDVVGSVGYRLGETYDIDKAGKVTLDEGLDNKLNINVFSGSHGISNFTTGYDEDTKEKLDTPIPNLYEKNNGNIAPRE
jgi:hypothetical protein